MMTYLATIGILFCILIYIYIGVFVLWFEQDCDFKKIKSLYYIGFNKICDHFCLKYPFDFLKYNEKYWFRNEEIDPTTISNSDKLNNMLGIFDVIIGMLWPFVVIIDSIRFFITKKTL